MSVTRTAIYALHFCTVHGLNRHRNLVVFRTHTTTIQLTQNTGFGVIRIIATMGQLITGNIILVIFIVKAAIRSSVPKKAS